MKTLIDYQDNCTYVGSANRGADEDLPLWKIMKIELDTIGKPVAVKTAGEPNTLYKWSDRVNLEYK